MELKNKNILIIGLSRSGEASANLALKHRAKVFVSEYSDNAALKKKARELEKKGAKVELGVHSEGFLQKADFLVTSPGVKNSAFPIVWAKKHGLPIISEIEFGSWFCDLPIVAITGSNGKTTVTTLTGKIFNENKMPALVAGNIGNPFSAEVMDLKNKKLVVLEVSSFQMEYTKKFRPKVSAILNLSQNHLDHHASMKEYFLAKARIMANQEKNDFAVLNFDEARIRSLQALTKAQVLFFSLKKNKQLADPDFCRGACWLEQDNIVCRFGAKREIILNINDIKLRGRHNLANIMACILMSKVFHLPSPAVAETIKKFKGLEHRCEPVRKIAGIDFVNDSKSTTVDATAKALTIFRDKSVLLICGGRDKGSDFTKLSKIAREKVSGMICFGEAREKIRDSLFGIVETKLADSLEHAVDSAFKMGNPGDSVLLSPMCASFDMFNNYEHRGKEFKKTVNRLKEKWTCGKQE